MKRILVFAWKMVRNYYVMVTLAFVVWVGFFDNDNWVSQYEQRKELRELMQQKKYYVDEIKKNNDLVKALSTDKKELERFGREKYLMKKPNEDIFLIINENVDENLTVNQK